MKWFYFLLAFTLDPTSTSSIEYGGLHCNCEAQKRQSFRKSRKSCEHAMMAWYESVSQRYAFLHVKRYRKRTNVNS